LVFRHRCSLDPRGDRVPEVFVVASLQQACTPFSHVAADRDGFFSPRDPVGEKTSVARLSFVAF
jgi:hypothetical protein